MTQTTEQERAEALAEKHGATSYRNRADTQNPAYGFTPIQLAALIAEIEQAARRAPAVPVPLRKPTIDQVADAVGYHDSAWDCVDPSELIDAILMLAAAPQPPEAAQLDDTNVADMAQAVDSKEAAHVQMPESVGCTTKPWGVAWNTSQIEAGTKLYTEQQVRQLLAAAKVERKPLTDEAIRTLYDESDGHWQMVGPQVLCFARSIESVHGIQEQST